MTITTSPRRPSFREALAAFEEQAEQGTVDIGRYRCRYAAWGDGPPLIFIHGWCDSYRSALLPMALLREEFRCIAYSQPTGGVDRARLRRYRHEHLVEDLFVLMDKLGCPRASLLAHSFGSTIALRAMHEDPRRISRAVLVAGFAQRPLVRGERWMAHVGRYLPGPMHLLPWRSEALKRSHWRPLRQYEPEVFQYYFDSTGAIPIRAASHWALHLHQTDLRELLPAIRHPVLLVAGEHDPLVPLHCQRQLFQELPNAVLFIINGCGHFPMYTHAEALAYAVVRHSRATECSLACGVLSPQAACPVG